MSAADERVFKKMKSEEKKQEENQKKEEDENEEDGKHEDKDQEDKQQDALYQFIKDLHEHRDDAGKLGEIQQLTVYKKKNAEAALEELYMDEEPKQEDEKFLLAEVAKYDLRLKLVKSSIEKNK